MAAAKAAGAVPTGALTNLGSEKAANPAGAAIRMERAAPVTTAVLPASNRSEPAARTSATAPSKAAASGNVANGTVRIASLAPANPAGSANMAKGSARLASLAPAHPVGSAATKSDGKMGFVGLLDRPLPAKARIAASPAIKLAAVEAAAGIPAATAMPIVQPGHHRLHRGRKRR
jgi:hypothetical protein